MAVEKAIRQIQGQFKVAAPSGEDGYDVENNETMEKILEAGKSYSQTITFAKDATKDQISNFLVAVMELCAGVFEMGQGTDLSGYPEITKKITTQYTLINL